MRTNNPALRRLRDFKKTQSDSASYSGIALKSFYFVMLTLVTATASFVFAYQLAETTWFGAVLIMAPILAFIFAMVASFAPKTTPVTGTIYAVLQGVSVGFISAVIDAAYSGVVFAALISTFSVFVVMTILYSTGIIRVGTFFRRFVMSALIGVLLAQLVIFIISLIYPPIAILFYGNGNFSIFISILMIIIASAMILIDLDQMTQIVNYGLDKRWEWVAAFGLLITLIWLYVEFLRLFSKISSRRN